MIIFRILLRIILSIVLALRFLIMIGAGVVAVWSFVNIVQGGYFDKTRFFVGVFFAAIVALLFVIKKIVDNHDAVAAE